MYDDNKDDHSSREVGYTSEELGSAERMESSFLTEDPESFFLFLRCLKMA